MKINNYNFKFDDERERRAEALSILAAAVVIGALAVLAIVCAVFVL